MKSFTMSLASLKVSGGTIQALRLLSGLRERGASGEVLCLWKSKAEIDTNVGVHYLTTRAPSVARAGFQYPELLFRFSRRLGFAATEGFIFTHYATYPLALFVPRARRLFFVQDLEWRFLGSGAMAECLRHVILWFYSRGRLIAANRYLADEIRRCGLQVEWQWPVWADSRFAEGATTCAQRDIDVVMVLRKGAHKRLDLYLSFLQYCEGPLALQAAVVTTEDEIAGLLQGRSHVECHVRATIDQMRTLYGRSKLFIHLSEHEGFGLPPLEAMGAGCIPLCRDSGGVRAFMQMDPALETLLLRRELSVAEVFARAKELLSNQARLADLAATVKRIFYAGLQEAERERKATENLLLTTSAAAP